MPKCACGTDLIEGMFHWCRPAASGQVADLQASLRDAVEQRDAAYRKLDAALNETRELQRLLGAWKRYHALLTDELDSAVGMAQIHGWRSTAERIELGVKIRLELGLPENGLCGEGESPVSDAKQCPRE